MNGLKENFFIKSKKNSVQKTKITNTTKIPLFNSTITKNDELDYIIIGENLYFLGLDGINIKNISNLSKKYVFNIILNTDNLPVIIKKSNDLEFHFTTVKKYLRPNSKALVLKSKRKGLDLSIDEKITITTIIQDIKISFQATIMYLEDNLISCKLHTNITKVYSKIFFRRKSLSYKTYCTIKNEKYQIEEISPFSIKILGFFDSYSILNEIDITLLLNDTILNTKALIIKIEKKSLIVSINTSFHSKENFLKLFTNLYFEPTKRFIKEDPKLSWLMLKENGFFDLVDKTMPQLSEDKFNNSWRELLTSYNNIQPLFCNEDEEGTAVFSLTKILPDSWMAHMFCSNTDSRYIDITSAQYNLWPIYMIGKQPESYISILFDSNKKWHQRFYISFFLENHGNSSLVMQYRHYIYINSIMEIELKTFDIQPILEKEVLNVEKMLENFYGCSVRNINYLNSKNITLDHFQKKVFSIKLKNKIVAIINLIKLSDDYYLNPTNIFNLAHLVILSESVKKSPNLSLKILNESYIVLKSIFSSKFSITLDYDFEFRNIEQVDYDYVILSSILHIKNNFLPSFYSNNLLMFEDIKRRN